ncbi:MAG TPA: ATP-dependent zinc protease [Chromatiales bacterium]|nr:ATP-dependent zinc protease [Chromatiales bacterium]
MVKELDIIGWREWISLPELGIDRVKAKVDTGARTSSLHAFDLRVDDDAEPPVVRFRVHPIQRSTRETVECEAPLLEWRWVRSSNGRREKRPVVATDVCVKGQSWSIEVTLASRDLMGFRMLLGREAFRRRFLVNAGRSFLTTRTAKSKKTKIAGKKRRKV